MSGVVTGRRWLRQLAIVMSALVVVLIVGWNLTYPRGDPKSLEFVLWRAGLYRMDLDLATDIMVGAHDSERIVVGRTREQLRERFGYLLTAGEATQYLRGCYQDSSWKDRDVLFIRRSPWLVLIKGC
jgi:hypothetical protein